MQKNQKERSSKDRVPISPPIIRPERTRAFLHDLVNVRDEQLDRLLHKYGTLLGGFYTSNELALYRDELRLLWHPTDGIPEREGKEFDEWLKIRPAAEPGEMICNRWLRRSRVGLVAVWEKRRRELMPTTADLPAILVYGCLLWGSRLFYCQNPKCGAPWFIGTRLGQRYCSNECSWPAKKDAKRKWWKANRGKDSSTVLPQRRNL